MVWRVLQTRRARPRRLWAGGRAEELDFIWKAGCSSLEEWPRVQVGGWRGQPRGRKPGTGARRTGRVLSSHVTSAGASSDPWPQGWPRLRPRLCYVTSVRGAPGGDGGSRHPGRRPRRVRGREVRRACATRGAVHGPLPAARPPGAPAASAGRVYHPPALRARPRSALRSIVAAAGDVCVARNRLCEAPRCRQEAGFP